MMEMQRLKKLAQAELTKESFAEMTEAADNLKNSLKDNPESGLQIERELIQMIQSIPMKDAVFIFFLSIIWNLFLRVEYLGLLLESVLGSDTMNVFHLEFINYQVTYFLFNNPEYKNERINELLRKLYNRICIELRKCIQVHPKSQFERNHNKVIVMTPNVLGERHAPTHSALERSCMLEEQFNESVCLVSAREGVFSEGAFPYYQAVTGNHVPAYTKMSTYRYKDKEFRFYQGKKNIDNVEGMQELVDFVENVNPYYILYIGGQSYVAELLNDFCPVLTVSTVFSSIPDCNTTFAMVGRKVTQEERNRYKSEIIEVPFSFELTEKEDSYSRSELGIPEDEFVFAVVGNRLNYDVKDEFLNEMQKVRKGFWVFIGSFDRYGQMIKKHSWLKERSVSLGRVEDVMGILECANLYVNPKRLGGGFSVIEAFHAGIPAVTIGVGDAAVAAGEEFCVSNYDEMVNTIQKYQSDIEFYEKKLARAKEREKEMTNGEAKFSEGIRQMLNSARFH